MDSLRRKGRPGVTTVVANCSIPIIDLSSRNVTLLCAINEIMVFLYFWSLSAGRRAVINNVSSSIPRNVSICVGPVVVFIASGMPSSSQRKMNFRSAYAHSCSDSATNKKSSNTLTMFAVPNLWFIIHFNAVDTASNILHDDEHPCGRHLS